MRQEITAAGFVEVDVLAVESIASPVGLRPDADPETRDAVLRAIRRVEREPALLGASSHLLAVATEPRTD